MISFLHIIKDEKIKKILHSFYSFMSSEKQYSKHTIESYLFDLKDFFEFFLIQKKDINISEIANLDIEFFRSWIESRINNKIQKRSNARAISGIKTFFKFLQENKHCQNSAIFLLKKPKLPKLLPKALDEEMVFKFIEGVETLKSQEWQKQRDKAIITLLFCSGLRISEALNLKREDLNGDFFYVKGKGSKERIVPMFEEVRNLVKKYLDSCPFTILQNELVFISNTGQKYTSRLLQRVFQQIRTNCNLPDYITPHKMRHSCATSLLNASNDNQSLVKIQILLGHQNLSTTQIYTKVAVKSIESELKKTGYWDS